MSDTWLKDHVIQVMRQAHGWDLALFDEPFLMKSLERRLAASTAETPRAYLEHLVEDHAEAEALLHSLRIGYSEFFRDPLTFAVLEQRVLPALVQEKEKSGRAEIRVWSAGCAAGQEAYSLAILLIELADARERPVPFRIFGTDVSESDLALAREGVYDEAALRNVRLRHLGRWFVPHGRSYAVAAGLRERVDLSVYDLLDTRSRCPAASIFGEFDVVLCCNLLLYYRPDIRQFILNKIRGCLAPNSYLVTGETERELVQGASGLRALAPPAAVFHREG